MRVCPTIALLLACIGMAADAAVTDVWDFVDGTWQWKTDPQVTVTIEKTKITIKTDANEEVWDIVGGTNRPPRLTVRRGKEEEPATYTREFQQSLVDMLFRLGERTWVLRARQLASERRKESLLETPNAPPPPLPPVGVDVGWNFTGIHLNTLDGSENTGMTHLECNRLGLTNLDISHNSELTYLNCSKNGLTTLDLSNNPLMTRVYCDCNRLTNLIVAHNPNIVYLWCSDNDLTSLDLSHNPNLETLWCRNNRLTELDISSNRHLQNIALNGNRLLTNIVVWWTPPDMSNKPSTLSLKFDGNPTLSNPTPPKRTCSTASPDLRVAAIDTNCFCLKFKGIVNLPDGARKFQLTLHGDKRTYFLKLGDEAEGFKLLKHEEAPNERRVQDGLRSIPKLTVQRGDRVIVLTYNEPTDVVEYKAHLVTISERPPYLVKEGEEFDFGELRLKVKTIDPILKKVLIVGVKTGEEMWLEPVDRSTESSRAFPSPSLAGCSFAHTNYPISITSAVITNLQYEMTANQKTQFISTVTNLVMQRQWTLCIRILQGSKDQTIQRLVLDGWNKSLAADDDTVPAQVYTLVEEWDRRLLTDQFWNTLLQTKNRKTVNAMSYVLYRWGNRDDLDHMKRIEKQVHERGLMNAINYLEYRFSGETNDPGPAACPPSME